MKSRPILFSTPMVQAVLQGRKTQTRRLVKQTIEQNAYDNIPTSFGVLDKNGNWVVDKNKDPITLADVCPYGQVGDVLWVRETWAKVPTSAFGKNVGTVVKDGWSYQYRAGWDKSGLSWKPSIHMPKEACRLKLRITNIKVERLHDISNKDIEKEGAAYFGCTTHRLNWENLWNKINGVQSWNDNPWVWVIEFEVFEKITN